MGDDHFVWKQFSVAKGVDRWEGFAVFDQDPNLGRPGTFVSFPTLTLTICGEFLAVRVARHLSVVLAEPCVPDQLVIQHSPRRILAGLGRRKDGDDVGDIASVKRRVDVPFQVIYGLSFGRAISCVKDLEGSPKVTADAPV